MSRQDFLETLVKAISHLSASEIESVLKHYNDIIDERLAKGEKEEAIIASFGPIDEIIKKIMDTHEQEKKIDAKEEIQTPIVVEQLVEQKSILEEKREKEEGKKPEEKVEPKKKKEKKKGDRKKTAGQITVIVLTSPLWIAFLLFLFMIPLSVSIAFIGLVLALAFTSILGLFIIVASFFHMGFNAFGGIFQFGLGLIAFVAGILLITLLIFVIKWVWKLFVKATKWIGGKF